MTEKGALRMWNRGPAPELELPGFSYIERYCPLLQPPWP